MQAPLTGALKARTHYVTREQLVNLMRGTDQHPIILTQPLGYNALCLLQVDCGD